MKQNKVYLSKSDYLTGLSCEKALWFKKIQKLHAQWNESTLRVFAVGTSVHARFESLLYPGGVCVQRHENDLDFKWGHERTKELTADKSVKVLFEATCVLPDGRHCRIDILRRNGRGWDMIEMKSNTSVTEKNCRDLAYQRSVFEAAGYKIKKCYVEHINTEYVRGKKLDPRKVFTCEDVTDVVSEYLRDTPKNARHMINLIKSGKEPEALRDKDCFACPYFYACWKDLPDFTVFHCLKNDEACSLYETSGITSIEDVDPELLTTKERILQTAHIKNRTYVDKAAIRDWLDSLKYPLYFLDYETVMPAIPLFEGTRPYQQIPFQFSLHIQKKKDGPLKHIEFVHEKKTDPRRALAEKLVASCGKKGSVIAYYSNFEKSRNEELAEAFSDLAPAIRAINDRMVDIYEPFKKRALYSPKQKGSASLKATLPAFCPKFSYKDLDIQNGTMATGIYERFLSGEGENAMTNDEIKAMIKNLKEYCGLDTLAMVKLLDVLYTKTKK